MSRRKRTTEPLPLPTIWKVPDDLWLKIESVLDTYDPEKPVGRKRIDQRRALDGILYRLRSGVQWNYLPREFGDDSSIHRTFQRWVKLGIFEHIWAILVADCAELGGVDWQWQAADAALNKARLGGTLLVPTQQTAGRTA
jgi:putative transposase